MEKPHDRMTSPAKGPESAGQTSPATTQGGEEMEPIRPPVEYATPMKRLWAWVGVVYAVGWALLTAYALAKGDFPQGLWQLLTSPALAGLGGSAILRYREGKGRGGLPACIGLSGICFALAVWNLVRGLPVLLAQL